jgi:hypothetical protein
LRQEAARWVPNYIRSVGVVTFLRSGFRRND